MASKKVKRFPRGYFFQMAGFGKPKKSELFEDVNF
jgi:hypothetical protein